MFLLWKKFYKLTTVHKQKFYNLQSIVAKNLKKSWIQLYPTESYLATYRGIICHKEQHSILPDCFEFKEDIIFVCRISDLTVASISATIKLVNTRLNRLRYWSTDNNNISNALTMLWGENISKLLQVYKTFMRVVINCCKYSDKYNLLTSLKVCNTNVTLSLIRSAHYQTYTSTPC